MAASLDLGSTSIDLADYATTGLRMVAVGPSGIGKTNAGLLVAEQLASQGWLAVLLDPEGEIAELYEDVITGPDNLAAYLERRTGAQLVVVPCRDAGEFVPYGQAILEVVDRIRKPVFLVLDEAQMFSTSRRTGKAHKDVLGEASDLVNDFVQRGRKRALDLFLSAHRFSGSLHRTVFANRNLSLIGRQEDPTIWSALAPQFKGSGIAYAELAALSPGEFFCFSRRGIEKVVMRMAEALAAQAPKASQVRPHRPVTFSQWDRAVREIPTERLKALTGDVIALCSTIVGLPAQQLAAGTRALQDELATR